MPPPPPRSYEDVEHEREALDALLRSEGFAVFEKYALEEWRGAGFFNRIGAATNADDPITPKVVYKTALEVQRLFEWPRTRVKALQEKLKA